MGWGRAGEDGILARMDSTLSLREIQDRLRSGASVEDVAVEAGVEPAELAAYAGPILAEREYIAALARDSNVRRSGDSSAHRGLDAAVGEQLAARDIDPEEVVWDSCRVERRRWQVVASVQDGSTGRRAVFNYDVDGRYSVAANEDARWMLGEQPLPPIDTEAEPTLELTEEQRRARLAAEARLEGDWADAEGEPSSPSDLQTLRSMMDDYEQVVSGYEDTVGMLRDSREPAAQRRATRTPTGAQPSGATAAPSRRPRQAPEPEQPSLVEGDPAAPRKRTPRKRAQVPSWDEIVFGSTEERKR